jgi:hypothetical protein
MQGFLLLVSIGVQMITMRLVKQGFYELTCTKSAELVSSEVQSCQITSVPSGAGARGAVDEDTVDGPHGAPDIGPNE